MPVPTVVQITPAVLHASVGVGVGASVGVRVAVGTALGVPVGGTVGVSVGARVNVAVGLDVVVAVAVRVTLGELVGVAPGSLGPLPAQPANSTATTARTYGTAVAGTMRATRGLAQLFWA